MSTKRDLTVNNVNYKIIIDKNNNIVDIQPRHKIVFEKLRGRAYNFKILDNKNEEGLMLIKDYIERYVEE